MKNMLVITESIPIWLAKGHKELADYRCIWDWLKYNARARTIQYSKKKARERNEKKKDSRSSILMQNVLSKQIQIIWKQIFLILLKNDMLELFYEEKVKGIIIRARARWHEYDEKSTEYFLNLEKRNHVKKHMRKLNINGSFTTDPFKILSEQQQFYKELYSCRDNNDDNSPKTELFLKDLNAFPNFQKNKRYLARVESF